MRSGTRIFLSLLPLFLVSLAFGQGAKLSPENPAESERDRPQERANWFLRGRLVNGKPGAEQLHRAYNQKLNNRKLQGPSKIQATQTSGATAALPRPLAVLAPIGSPPWTFLGPAPTATAALSSSNQDYGPAVGRVTAVAVDQSDATGNTVYIGGASGGIWKTTNAVSAPRTCVNGVCSAPVVWTPLTDGQATLTVGSIALQPGNSSVVLVGTGEANNSADSYYGLGILRSTDGGGSWNLISSATCLASNAACAAPPTVFFHGLGFTRIAFSTDNPNIVVATAAAASAGIGIGAETGGGNARGIYFSSDAGVTWNRATVLDGAIAPDPGSANSVIYNPKQKKFYANLRFHGFYSSPDGANWTRLGNQPSTTGVDLSLANCPSHTSSACPLYRAEMALAPGRDEMYVWIYDSSENDKGIFQTKDGGLTWTPISTTGIDSCGETLGCGTGSGGQGTYNITLAAVPNGGATDLYAGGVNQYKCTVDSVSNATCTSKPFLNLTHVYGCNPVGSAHVHPDEHGIDFLGNDATGAFVTAHSGFDPPIFFGNDGGIYRVSHGSSLSNGTCPANGALPNSPFDNLNTSSGFSMLQFVGFSQHATDATTLLGGTQDNGSPGVSIASPSLGNWLSVNNGDGGFNAINPLNAGEWFTSNPAPLTSGGGIQRCLTGISCTNQTFQSVVTQDKIGADFSAFYTFFMLDPQASHRMFVGSCRVWRGNSDGSGSDWSVAGSGGIPLSANFDTGVTGAGATCADPTNNPVFMVNTMAAGGPCSGTGICDPGIPLASASGGGSQVIWAGMEGIADASTAAAACPNGAPCGGQVWVTTQADADLATTPNKWQEVSGLGTSATPKTTAACTATPSSCNINPKHYNISGIALDLNDPTGRSAYVTVMGFGVGHIFKTTDAGATWAKLDGDPNGTGLPDAPADAVVTPPASAIAAFPTLANIVYVGTDVGVFSSTGNGTWTEVGPGSGAGSLPNVAITQLKIYNNSTDTIPLRLRASTYGRGIWEVPIAPVPGFQVTITPSTATAVIGQTASYSGSIVLFNAYNSPIALSCQSLNSGAVPATCTVTPSTLAAGATSFTVTAGDSAANTFNFRIVAVGADPKRITQQASVILNSVTPFTVGTAANVSTPAGAPATTSFTLTASTAIAAPSTLSLACPSGLPAGAGPCTFSPAAPTLAAGVTASINVTIPIPITTAVGSYPINITATSGGFSLNIPFTLNVLVAPDFIMSALSPATLNLSPTDTATASFTLKPNETLSGSAILTCTGLPAGAPQCNFSPQSPNLTAGQATATLVNLTIPLSGVAPGAYTVTVNSDVTTPSRLVHHFQTLSLNVTTNSFGITAGVLAPTTARPGQSLSVSATITPSAFSGTVSLSCAVADAAGGAVPGAACVMTVPSMVFTNSSVAQSSSANVTTNTTTPATNQVLTVTAGDGTTSKKLALNYAVVDYTLTAGAAAPVLANGATTSVALTLAGVNGFTGGVQVQCNVPSPLTCTLNPASPYSLTASTTASAIATITAPSNSGGTYSATLNSNDAGFATLAHSQTVSIAVQDWQVAASPTSETVKAGGTPAAHTITISGLGGFGGTIALSCFSGLPPLATCTFSPASVAAGGTSTLTIQTTAPSVSQMRMPAIRHSAPLYALWLTMPGMALGFIGVTAVPKRRRSRVLACIGLALIVGLLLAMAACGGGGGSSVTTPPPIPKPGTPAGPSIITVTGTSGSGATILTHSTQITLTVQ